MIEKINSWWSDDGEWFCILVNDGVNHATVSLTREEAKALARNADPEVYEKLTLVRRQRDDMTDAFNASIRNSAAPIATPTGPHGERG